VSGGAWFAIAYAALMAICVARWLLAVRDYRRACVALQGAYYRRHLTSGTLYAARARRFAAELAYLDACGVKP